MNLATLTMSDGTRLVTPDSLANLANYVIREQGDWYEDEARFVRLLVQSGQKCLDIGAGHGAYSMILARAVGPQGHVWSFEPAADLADLVAQSATANSFDNVTVTREGLSSRSQPGALVSLDDAMNTFQWHSVAFVRIDPSAADAGAISGGRAFFEKHAPVVMVSVRHGEAVDLNAANELAAKGFDLYRLIPGLTILGPFDRESVSDSGIRHVFAIRPERARKLESRELLATAEATNRALVAIGPDRIEKEFADNPQYHWSRALARLEYSRDLMPLWTTTCADASHRPIEVALWLARRSEDTTLSAAERLASLESACTMFAEQCQKQPSGMRVATLARLLAAYGARQSAANALQQMISRTYAARAVDPSEPFLPASENFDAIAPTNGISQWAAAGMLEKLERVGTPSSYFSTPASEARIGDMGTLGYLTEEMSRRREVIAQRAAIG